MSDPPPILSYFLNYLLILPGEVCLHKTLAGMRGKVVASEDQTNLYHS